MRIDLKDKIVLVPGAASGIGRASALAAHGCGARVIVADKAFHEAAQISSGLAGSLAVGFDVTDERQVAQEVSRIEDDIGPIDGLVHAVGVLQRPLPPHQLTMREWDIVNQVDFRGSYIVAASVGSQ